MSPTLRFTRALGFGLLVLFAVSEESRGQTSSRQEGRSLVLPTGTSVILHLTESLYKKDAKAGRPIAFEVAYDVVVNGQICVARGTSVTGTFRGLERTDKGQQKVLIDIGMAQTVAGNAVRLTSATPGKSSDEFDPMMVAEFPPLVPIVLIARLFEKKKLLDENAGAGWGAPGGLWIVVRTAEEVTLDGEKQKVAQAEYVARREGIRQGFQRALDPSTLNLGDFSLFPNSLGKAGLLETAGDLDGALAAYQETLDMLHRIPDSPVLSSLQCSIQMGIAKVLVEKAEYAQAIDEYRGIDEAGPCAEQGQVGLIKTLERSGNSDAAITEARKAIQKWPQNTEMRYLLGHLLVEKKEAEGAIEVLQGALAKGIYLSGPVNCELGRAFELKGDVGVAEKAYRKGIKLGTKDDECRAAYERLRKHGKS